MSAENRAAYRRAAAPIVFDSTATALTAIAQCSVCKKEATWTLKSSLPPPEILRKHFTVRGWGLRKKALCPACNKGAILADPTPAPEPALPPQETVMPEPTPAEQTEAAKRMRRFVYQALEDYYDDTARAYRPGHSDSSIASDTGAAEAFVRQIREQDFGPLAMPAELSAIMDAVMAAQQQAKEASAEAAALGDRALAALKKSEAAHGMVEKARNELQALASKKGWVL